MENSLVLSNPLIIDDNIPGIKLKYQKIFYSVYRVILFAVKVTLFSTLTIIYSAIALSAFILYQLLFKHIFQMLFREIIEDKPESSYSCSWENQHHDLNWEA
ncbi:MAG: hypothetical protein IPN67_01495 [Bacteroidales bacterium]|nr:hypothetical protein [Bacteroidales bacterium]